MEISATITRTDGRPVVLVGNVMWNDAQIRDAIGAAKQCKCGGCTCCLIEKAVWLARQKASMRD